MYVVGFPRSGTTLLAAMLDRHSKICVPPESRFYEEIDWNTSEKNRFIQLSNSIRLKDFSLCKIGTVDEQIVDDVMDTKNPRALFVIEDENNQPLVTFNSDTEKNPIKLRNIGVENADNSLYYDQYYTPFGRNVETLSTINTGNFKFKRVI